LIREWVDTWGSRAKGKIAVPRISPGKVARVNGGKRKGLKREVEAVWVKRGGPSVFRQRPFATPEKKGR